MAWCLHGLCKFSWTFFFLRCSSCCHICSGAFIDARLFYFFVLPTFFTLCPVCFVFYEVLYVCVCGCVYVCVCAIYNAFCLLIMHFKWNLWLFRRAEACNRSPRRKQIREYEKESESEREGNMNKAYELTNYNFMNVCVCVRV